MFKNTIEPAVNLEEHFSKFRKNITGHDQYFIGPQGKKKILYADWTASGRLYDPIEKRLSDDIGPFVANTHTETSMTGKMMTQAYHDARNIIKQHVNASSTDIFLPVGTGMTGAVNKFQRILGIKIPERCNDYAPELRKNAPVIFVTHMEHHSNQTSWNETLCKVEIIKPTNDGLVDLNHLDELIAKYKGEKQMIASVTGCSNVTGIETPYYEIARKMHRAGGLCFVDFACSGPYVSMDMHPADDPDAYLDAIFFSPHKFLGGPGTPGALIFNSSLYNISVPESPGGGTVTFTDPWGKQQYHSDIETREDGGTPGFMQTIKAALCVKLKDEMGVENIRVREHQMLETIFKAFDEIPNAHIFAGHVKERLGVISFFIEEMHFNLGVKLLNDYYGIQARGGCSCAGTYGHMLFHIDEESSCKLFESINTGNLAVKPGWIRISIHPTMTDKEVEYLCQAVKDVSENWRVMGQDYTYSAKTNEYYHNSFVGIEDNIVENWFETPITQ